MTNYEILGLQPGATPAEIKSAYFSLVRRHSPENDPEGFMKLRTAYEALTVNDSGEEKLLQFSFDIPLSNPKAIALVRSFDTAMHAGAFELAIDYAEQGTKAFPDEPWFWFYACQAYISNGNSNKAIKAAEKLYAITPGDHASLYLLGRTYLTRGYNKKAWDAFEMYLTPGAVKGKLMLVNED